MAHLQHLEDSTFLELINTPFSPVRFTEEERELLREMEVNLLLGRPLFTPEQHR